MDKANHITNINDCMDLFPMSAVVMVFRVALEKIL